MKVFKVSEHSFPKDRPFLAIWVDGDEMVLSGTSGIEITSS